MDAFRKVIEKREKLLILGVIVLFILYGVVYILDGQYSIEGSHVEFAFSFYLGLIIGALLLILIGIYQYGGALKNEQKLKKLYINEHDERKKLIKDKMAKAVVVTVVILLIVAIGVSIYFQPIVAITLICVLYAMMFIAIGFKLYYSQKY